MSDVLAPLEHIKLDGLEPNTWYSVRCYWEPGRTRIYLNGKLAIDTAPPFHGKKRNGRRRR